MTFIDWSLLGSAVSFYENKGYKNVDVPWMANNTAISETVDESKIIKLTNHIGLIGSAEQSFLDLTINSGLPKNKYVSCTPCFREEDSYTEIHKPHFMKVELFDSSALINNDLTTMIADAISFMSKYIPDIELRKTAIGYDIMYKELELGSYGIRKYIDPDNEVNNFSWIYGTGLAEPRFSIALQQYKNS